MARYFATLGAFVLCNVLLLGGCQNSKLTQDNTQLKAQVADLQKQVGDMGNRVDEATKAKEDLAKQNAALTQELNRLKSRRSAAKPAKSKKRRRPTAA